MNAYDLLQESALRGHGRTLTFDQCVWLLTLIQNMDKALGEFMSDLNGDLIVDAEVIDGEQILEGEGLDGSDERVDSPQQEETTETVHEAL